MTKREEQWSDNKISRKPRKENQKYQISRVSLYQALNIIKGIADIFLEWIYFSAFIFANYI